MTKTIRALTFDAKKDGWETSRGYIMRNIPMPVWTKKNHPEDVLSVIVKMHYAGVCGSERGFWYRNAFRDLVHDSLAREKKTMRITGHELGGEIVAAGSMVTRLYRHARARLHGLRRATSYHADHARR